MPQAPSYNRRKNFIENNSDRTDHAAINAELDKVSISLNATRENLSKIQADDGSLISGSVLRKTLSKEVVDYVTSIANNILVNSGSGGGGDAGSASAAAASAALATTKATEAQNFSNNASVSAHDASISANEAASSASSASSHSSSASASSSAASLKAQEASASAGSAAQSATTATQKSDQVSAAEIRVTALVNGINTTPKMPMWTTLTRPQSPLNGAYGVNLTIGKPEWFFGRGLEWRTFDQPGTNLNNFFVIEYILVAGGGGGGPNKGGGGGAGGVVYGRFELSGSINVVVGGGGAGAEYNRDNAQKGGDTYTTLARAVGGGTGRGLASNDPGEPVGSGGGGSRTEAADLTPSIGGMGIQGQGFAGGAVNGAGNFSGGGGGGAGGDGQSTYGDSSPGGNGGVGITTYSDWAQATGTGVNGGFAGGGGGAGNEEPGGIAVNGGGNGGRGATAGQNATVNTGGGGGAPYGRGASGIAIFRYIGNPTLTGGIISTINGYTYHVFKSDGALSS